MSNSKWIATKKECSINSEGKLITEKVTLEKSKHDLFSSQKKELIDMLIRSIGALSIFIPLILLYFQRQNEIRIEQSKNLSELFTNISTDLQIVANSNTESKDFSTAYENILFRYNPKVHLMKNDSLNQLYTEIINYTNFHKYLKHIQELQDTLLFESSSKIYGIYSTIDRYGDENGEHDNVSLHVSKLVLIKELKKAQADSYKLQAEAHLFDKTMYNYHIHGESNITTYFLRDTLETLAFNVLIEMNAFEEYLVKPTNNWFKSAYLNQSKTVYSVNFLKNSAVKIVQALAINKDYIEKYRGLFEKETLRIL